MSGFYRRRWGMELRESRVYPGIEARFLCRGTFYMGERKTTTVDVTKYIRPDNRISQR